MGGGTHDMAEGSQGEGEIVLLSFGTSKVEVGILVGIQTAVASSFSY